MAKHIQKFTVYMPGPFGRMKRVEVREFEFQFKMVGGTLELFGYYTPKGARCSLRYVGLGSHVVVLDGWGHPDVAESEIGMATRANVERLDAMLAEHIQKTGATIVADYRRLGHAA